MKKIMTLAFILLMTSPLYADVVETTCKLGDSTLALIWESNVARIFAKNLMVNGQDRTSDIRNFDGQQSRPFFILVGIQSVTRFSLSRIAPTAINAETESDLALVESETLDCKDEVIAKQTDDKKPAGGKW